MATMIIDYLKLRQLIGYVGVLLPIVLIVGKWIFNPGPLPGSISDYHYTAMRDVLTGAMALIGGFLSTYMGYQTDHIPVRMAAAGAIGVAIFPTVPPNPNHFNDVIGLLHGFSAAVFFVSCAIISFFLFTRSGVPAGARTVRKLQRNVIYRICGVVMGLDLLLVPVLTSIPSLEPAHPMFILETVAVEAFGISWLVKGQAILRDKE